MKDLCESVSLARNFSPMSNSKKIKQEDSGNYHLIVVKLKVK